MICLRNGSRYEIQPEGARCVLPNGTEVLARPNAESPRMARKLGYGDDVIALTQQHDPLHLRLTDMLGMPHSFSLMQAAGFPVDGELASLEEDAVLATQRFYRAWENKGRPR